MFSFKSIWIKCFIIMLSITVWTSSPPFKTGIAQLYGQGQEKVIDKDIGDELLEINRGIEAALKLLQKTIDEESKKNTGKGVHFREKTQEEPYTAIEKAAFDLMQWYLQKAHYYKDKGNYVEAFLVLESALEVEREYVFVAAEGSIARNTLISFTNTLINSKPKDLMAVLKSRKIKWKVKKEVIDQLTGDIKEEYTDDENK